MMHSSGEDRAEVVVVDIDMEFMAIVRFMIKWALASIPAIIILWFLFVLVGGLFIGIMGGFGGF
jgi:hypothetical protein